MNKKLSAAEVLKEAAILTAAVAIIAAAVYFFLVPSHQQHFRPWHRAVKFRAAAAVDDHDDFERRPAVDRLSHLRAGIRSEDRLYERDAAGVSGAF